MLNYFVVVVVIVVVVIVVVVFVVVAVFVVVVLIGIVPWYIYSQKLKSVESTETFFFDEVDIIFCKGSVQNGVKRNNNICLNHDYKLRFVGQIM